MRDTGRTPLATRPPRPRSLGNHAAYLGLGSNLGARTAHLQRAVDRLMEAPAVREVAVSPVYESEAHTPVDTERAPDYLNAVVRLTTSWTPLQLLEYAQMLEREAGRRRSEERRWAPRTLDVDVLLIGGLTCRTSRLTVPHPRMGERRFVLQPLVDLDPDLSVPAPYDAPAKVLLGRCSDWHALRLRGESLRAADPATGDTGRGPGSDFDAT